jgi:sugar O-acyltransferase (sialic acid O-acetyltransferase NeuD family)
MKIKDIILIGGGGHCRSCIDVIEEHGGFCIKGILDRKDKLHHNVSGYEIVGTDKDIPRLAKIIDGFLITVGHVRSAEIRKSIYGLLSGLSIKPPVIISPKAYVSKHSKIADGSIIMHHAVINAGAAIGRNCIINTKAIVEHDARVGNHCHISTGAIVNGGAQAGDGCLIGSNATVLETISIANSTIVGAGAVVHRPITSSGIYAGNPARRIRGT